MIRKLTIILLVVVAACRAEAQEWAPEVLASANTAANVAYLNQEEKDMIFYLNLARTDGALFFKTYFKVYMERHNLEMQKYSNYAQQKIDKRDNYYRSLENDLKKIKGLPLLFPDERLCKMSLAHADDMNKNNFSGHNSSNGNSFVQRIDKVYPNRAAAENLAFGSVTGLDIVCALLLDKGIPGLGHRLNMLNSTYKFSHIGASIRPHPYYKVCAVMDFVALPAVAQATVN